MLSIEQAISADDLDTVRQLFLEYQALLSVDLCFQGFATEVANLPGAYTPPDGRLLLAKNDGVAVGCIALRKIDASRSEMKRLFVRPTARGLGVGRALITKIIDDARTIGYAEIVLDTLPTMTEAQNLYSAFGFQDIPPYRDNPIIGTRYLGLRLTTS
jgi:putative acetyltransferase